MQAPRFCVVVVTVGFSCAFNETAGLAPADARIASQSGGLDPALVLTVPSDPVTAPTSGGRPGWRVVLEASGPERSWAGATLVYDAARRSMFYVDDDHRRAGRAWEWDGQAWITIRPTTRAFTNYSAMVYDSLRARVVRIGARDFYDPDTYERYVAMPQTWEWDGRAWTEMTPATSFTPTEGSAMVYDAARQRTVVFGGLVSDGLMGPLAIAETWEWDGSDWQLRTPTVSPPPRAWAGMAYDESRERAVLFGGWGRTGELYGDTWEWDGTSWLEIVPPVSPSGRSGPAMAFSAAADRVVLFGGVDWGGYWGDTWEWDGVTWVMRTPDHWPTPRRSPGMAFDPRSQRLVMFGGWNWEGFYKAVDTWEWDGTDWYDMTVPPSPKPSNIFYAGGLAYDRDRGRAVFAGGRSGSPDYEPVQTWERADGVWVDRGIPTGPLSRRTPCLAYDAVRQRVVFTGGISASGADMTDTWEWDGTSWTQVAATGAPPRYCTIAFHSVRGHVMVVSYPPESLNMAPMRTWEWDGAVWSELATPTSPPGRNRPGLAYDSNRDRLVLFGGTECHIISGYLWSCFGTDDLWEWDGSLWEQRTPATSPPKRFLPTMTFDESRGRIVLAGGFGLSGSRLHDVWEWDGNEWTETTTREAPTDHGAVAYDTVAGQTLFVDFSMGDTWTYGPIDPCAHAVDVMSFSPGAGTDQTTAVQMLGARDDQAVSLGTGGAVVLAVTPPIRDGMGTDVIVYEAGALDGDVDERYGVEVSLDNVNFYFVRDCVGGECLVDLARSGLDTAAYIRITDAGQQTAGVDPPQLGADIDAVVAVHCSTRACSNPAQPDGTVCTDNDLCTTGDACRAGICTPTFSGLDEPNPRTNGYYKRLCHGPHSGDELTDADAGCVAQITTTFAGISTAAEICGVIEPSRPNNDRCEQSEDDLMVLALNICRARVCTAQEIESQCGGNTSVGQSLAESDAILASPSRNFDTCSHAKCLDEEINTGQALEVNSLTLGLEAGAVRLTWEPPYLKEWPGAPARVE